MRRTTRRQHPHNLLLRNFTAVAANQQINEVVCVGQVTPAPLFNRRRTVLTFGFDILVHTDDVFGQAITAQMLLPNQQQIHAVFFGIFTDASGSFHI